jgi:hypothetical protein
MNLSHRQQIQSPPEPLEIQMYGWTMSFPTWLVLQLGTYVLLLLLLVGCYEVLFPSTGVAEHIHHLLNKEPYALEVLSWAPTGLLLIGVVELCETTVGMILFRNKWLEINSRNEPQDFDCELIIEK